MAAILKGYLRLCRPPNLPTAASNILAGASIVGFFSSSDHPWNILFLVFSSIFLYAGGVVFNDYFDYELDKKERPERPLPSGLIHPKQAAGFGTVLFLIGVGLAAASSLFSGSVALLLVFAILLYDAKTKGHAFFGPLNMGVCRGLNLFLGMSIFQDFSFWPYTLIPVVFIFAVTLISRGEVHGNNKRNIAFSAFLYAFVLVSVIILHKAFELSSYTYLIFLSIFAFMVFKPLYRAYVDNIGKNIMKAVKAGVLSLILLDAALASAYADWQMGVVIVLLLPLSILLAKVFAVT